MTSTPNFTTAQFIWMHVPTMITSLATLLAAIAALITASKGLKTSKRNEIIILEVQKEILNGKYKESNSGI